MQFVRLAMAMAVVVFAMSSLASRNPPQRQKMSRSTGVPPKVGAPLNIAMGSLNAALACKYCQEGKMTKAKFHGVLAATTCVHGCMLYLNEKSGEKRD